MGADSNLLTYEALYDILRNEKTKEDLQKLDPYIYVRIVEYIKSKRQILKKAENSAVSEIEKERIKTQIFNIRKLVKDLFERREKKIIALAVNKTRTSENIISEALLPEERLFLEETEAVLTKNRKEVLLTILNGILPGISIKSGSSLSNSTNESDNSLVNNSIPAAKNSPEKNLPTVDLEKSKNDNITGKNVSPDTILIRFNSPLQKFIGPDFNEHGPFVVGDELLMPEIVAKFLIDKNLAAIVDRK
ncbi:MAG: hypothetical protein V1859_00550 [archaeon]